MSEQQKTELIPGVTTHENIFLRALEVFPKDVKKAKDIIVQAINE